MPSAPTEPDRAALDKMLRFNDLLDAYGALLTDRQLRLARKHFQEDLSFSEIAREEGVSRQAAHDAVKHAGMTLERFESHLRLVQQQHHPAMEWMAAQKQHVQMVEQLEALIQRIEDQPDGHFTRQWTINEIQRLCEMFKSGLPHDDDAERDR